MSVNKERPHLLVLPEDKANRQLANGFWLELDPTRQRQMQVLSAAGGWNEVLNLFGSVHIPEMDHCPTRFMVLLIDFDGHEERLERARDRIPQHLAERVFVLGALIEPEALKPHLGSYEEIGSRLAADCRDDSYDTWGHALLQHNAIELARLREHVRRILFPTV